MERLPFVAGFALMHLTILKERALSGHTYNNGLVDSIWLNDLKTYAQRVRQVLSMGLL